MRVKLTPQIQQTICAFIASGGFPTVACEAAGIPQETFLQWMNYGTNKTSQYRKYALFREEVLKATATARLTAEIKAHDEEPLKWLQQGPGKETKESPGWTVPVKPQVTQTNQTINLLLNPEMQGLFAAILQVLSPFPEARQAVSEALANNKPPPKIISSK